MDPWCLWSVLGHSGLELKKNWTSNFLLLPDPKLDNWFQNGPEATEPKIINILLFVVKIIAKEFITLG